MSAICSTRSTSAARALEDVADELAHLGVAVDGWGPIDAALVEREDRRRLAGAWAILRVMRPPGPAWWSGVRTATVVTLAIALVASSVATAAPIPPELSDSARDADLATIARALEGRLVAAHLRTLGLTPEAIEVHLARLDDGELHQMAQSLPELGVGGQQQELTPEQKAGVVLLIVVALAVVAGLVFLTLAVPLF